MDLMVGQSEFPNELWRAALGALERKYTKPMFEMWVKPIRPIAMSESEIVFTVQSIFARRYVEESRVKGDICEVLTELLGTSIPLRFVVSPDAPSGPPEEADMPSRSGPRATLAEDLRHGNLNDRYTFAEFVVGNSNRFAHAASQAVAEAPARAYNPLFLYGGVGLGKTHLMHAIGHQVIAKNTSANVVYVSSEKFTNEFIVAVQKNQTLEFRNKYRLVDVLLIDEPTRGIDVGSKEQIYGLIDELAKAGKAILMVSSYLPELLGTCDRIAVMNKGILSDAVDVSVATQESLMHMAVK